MQFLPLDQRKIPSNCFVANEAVHWLVSNLQGDVTPDEAVEMLQVKRPESVNQAY